MMKKIVALMIFVASISCAGRASAYRLIFGDLHSHTSFSDGKLLPDDAWDMARNMGGAGFWTVSDHYEQLDMMQGLPEDSPKVKEWDYMREHARSKTEDGWFVALAAYEWFDQPEGHINVLNTPELAKFGQTYNYKQFVKWVKKNPEALIGFNHPFDSARDGAKIFDDLTYIPEIASQTFYIAVNGMDDLPWYYKALDRGWHVAPSGQQDNHKADWGTAQSGDFTGAYVDKVTYNSLIDAFVHRRIYATNNKNIRLWLDADGAVMGSEVNADTVNFNIQYLIDGGIAAKSVSLLTNGGAEVKKWDAPKDTEEFNYELKVDFTGTRWFAVLLIDSNGKFAISAPVWVSPASK